MITIPTNPVLAEHAVEIRRLHNHAIGDVIEIGRRLTECKRICGHGNWLPWLDREFGCSGSTALRYMQVYEMSKSVTVTDLDVPTKSLYLLAAPSTPETARTEIIERAQSGEIIPICEVKRTIDAAKGRKRRDYSTIYRAAKLGDDVVEKLRGTSSSGELARKDSEIDELCNAKQRVCCRLRFFLALITELDMPLAWTAEEIIAEINHPNLTSEHLRRAGELLHRMADALAVRKPPPADDGLDIPANPRANARRLSRKSLGLRVP